MNLDPRNPAGNSAINRWNSALGVSAFLTFLLLNPLQSGLPFRLSRMTHTQHSAQRWLTLSAGEVWLAVFTISGCGRGGRGKEVSRMFGWFLTLRFSWGPLGAPADRERSCMAASASGSR